MAATSIATVQAMRVSQFAASLGVDAHMEYNDGAYANASEAVSDLNYLGIHQLREGTPDSAGGSPYLYYLNSLNTLADAGNRFEFVTAPGDQALSASLEQISNIANAHAGAVFAIEGPNEINNWPISYAGKSGEAAGEAFQHDLYSAVKASPGLNALPVYYFTGGQPIDIRSKGFADDANGHPYPYQGQAPGPRIVNEFQTHFSMPPPYARVITETGYFNQPNSPYGSGVDDATQAKLTLDLLFDAFQQGVSKTFLYQLRSAYPDPQGNNPDTEYGLFNLDNSPKPVATAIHNLTLILADASVIAPSFTTGSLAYALSGLPASGTSLLLQKSTGAFNLVLWAEPTIWNEATHTPVTAAGTTITLTLRAPARFLRVFDPMRQTAPIAARRNSGSIAVSLSDHPLVVQIVQ